MTLPDDDATTLDPGRVDPTPTTLDPGRRRPSPPGPGPAHGDDDETDLDPGRVRPDTNQWGASLPAGLAARYVLGPRMNVPAAEADLFELRERGPYPRRLVLKVYHHGRAPDERVWAALRGRRSQHIVELVEVGRESSRSYEVQEYLPEADLLALRKGHQGTGLDARTLTTVVRQVSTALKELHDAGLVHRDIKPSNLMLRARDPLDVVVIDVGLSTFTDGSFHPTRSATLAYAPPEWDSTYVSPLSDWWSLGITLVELATGRHPFEGLSDGPIRAHVTTLPVDVSGVRDERLRMLCQGLLTRNRRHRWQFEQVNSWLLGGSPQVVSDGAAEGHPGGANRALLFRGEPFHHRDLLATALATAWESAAAMYFGRDGAAFATLVEWLTQFPEYAGASGEQRLAYVRRLRRGGATPDVMLLRLLHELDPTRAPTYRRESITPALLPDLAQAAFVPGPARAVVADLWTHDLLALLATASGGGGTGSGGTGLAEANVAWRATEARWDAVVDTILDDDARAEVRSMDSVLAICLFAATAYPSHLETIIERLRQIRGELAAPLPWYDDLARPGRERLALVIAWVLRSFARRRAEDRREEIDHRDAVAHWEGRNRHLVRWSRRQNRIIALGWAVAGTAAVAALWVFIIGVSDSADVASDALVTDGWVVSVLSIGVVLAAEAILGVMIGARYPLRYSLVAAGLIALRPVAGRARQNGIVALVVVLAVLAGVALVTVAVPPAIPAASAVAVAVWAVVRYRAHLAVVRQEEDERRRDTTNRVEESV